MFQETTLVQYLAALAAKKEVPGGGSAAALVGALGVACAEMTANFSVDPQKFSAVSDEIKKIAAKLEPLQQSLQRGIDDDAIAFQKFKEIYALPKNTPEEKEQRKIAMQAAFAAALEPPLAVMKNAVAALEHLPRLCEIGNKNLITDTGDAAILLNAAVAAARLNVLINCQFIADKDRQEKITSEVATLTCRAAEYAQIIHHQVDRVISGE